MANKLVIGLAPEKKGFYDPKTNVSLSIGNSKREITFDQNTDLSGIIHAALCQRPAIQVYSGNLPEDQVKAWKDKYRDIGKQAITRGLKAETKPAEESGDVEGVSLFSQSSKQEEEEKEENQDEEKQEDQSEEESKPQTQAKTTGRGRGRKKKTQTDSE